MLDCRSLQELAELAQQEAMKVLKITGPASVMHHHRLTMVCVFEPATEWACAVRNIPCSFPLDASRLKDTVLVYE